MSTLIKTQGSNIVIGGKAIFSNPPSIDLLAGLQAFYKLSDTSDSSGNNNTLTVNGNVQFASGKIGDAAGINGGKLTSSVNFQLNGEFTFSSWVYLNDINTEYGLYGSNGQVIAIYQGQVYSNTGNGFVFIPDAYVQAGEWTFITINTAPTISNIWINGTKTSFNADAGSFGLGITNISIGCILRDYNPATPDNSLNGQIDAVGIWNRALTEGEVSALYNSGNGLELN